MNPITEKNIETFAIEILQKSGWQHIHGLSIAPGAEFAERESFDQIRTYKATIPGLFTYNAICIISDGMECRAGSVSAGFSRYMTWKSADGKKRQIHFNGFLHSI